MNPLVQRLQVAQELIGTLLGFLSQPLPPQTSQVQAALDAANAKLQAIASLEQATPSAPFVPPTVMPPTVKIP